MSKRENKKRCHQSRKIARHEIPDWCQHPHRGAPTDIPSNILYTHCSPAGEATTLDVGCYPPPGGGGTAASGPDLLPPKRQTVVDRLRRRLEVYRRHQGSCLPRYDQTANGLYDAQRQETLLLKQRFLEAKAKKTRRNDHHSRNTTASANGNETQRSTVVNQSKLKRQASSPLLDCAIDNIADSHSNKIPRSGQSSDKSFSSSTQSQTQQQQNPQEPGISSFSVQIVQQFTSSNTSQAPHSQTIQTNVTVQTLAGGSIKTSNSPSTVSTTSSPGCVASGNTSGDACSQMPNNVTPSSTSISVGTNIECKQEPDTNFNQCSINGSHPLPELSSDLNSANNNLNTATTSSSAATTGDRFSDSLANLGFPEDSNDDVIHPDILKDIIDDVFTNPSDLMNGFNFVDSIGIKENSNLGDDKDSLRPMMSLSKSIQNSPPNHFQNSANSPGLFSMNQSQQSVFDFQTGTVNSSSSPQSLPNNSSNVPQGFTSGRMGSYAASSPNLPSMANNGLGLDFKLTEPSPAAQTLKQMAEQHQNMQQKQQQLGLGISSSHPRSPFGSDSFPDPLSNIRSNFLNGSPNSLNSLQKSPTGLFQPMGFSQQQGYPPTSGTVGVKPEIGTQNTAMYSSNLNQHISDIELHKRRQQVLGQLQQNQMANISRPPFSHSPEQKRQYPGLRSLPLYNDPSPGHPPNDGSASNSPVPNHPQQFMRGVSTSGVTQSSQGFGSSPSPSSGTLYLSQSQQIQLSSNSQQLQVSQSQQQLIMSQDMKPSIAQQQQQQQHVQGRGFYGGQSAVHMSQSQLVNFQFSGSSRSASPTTNQRPSPSQINSSASGRHVQQQYMSRPPPDYQASIEPSGCNSGPINNMQSGLLSQNHQMQVNMPDNINIINDQSNRTIDHRNNTPVSVSQSYAGIVPISQAIPIPSSQSYPGSVPNSNVYSGLAHISNSPSISVSKSYPGLVSISDATSVSASDKSFPGTVPISDATSVSISRPYTGIVPVSNTVLLSSSKPYQGMVPISNSTAISISKPYPGVVSLSNSSGTKIYSSMNHVSNANPVSVSKSYPGSGPISSASASQSYTGVVPTSSLSEQVPTHSLMMPTTTTIAPTYSVSKGRGGSKQVNSRTFNKQCGPLRQHKAPNVNVGPEGLNISQRTMDWRHTYIQHQNQQQIVTHVNPQLRMSFPRGIAQNYGQNLGIANGNNFQVHHLNPNSPANNSRVVTSSPIADHALPIQQSGIHDINSSVTSHGMLQQQQQQVIINSDNNTLLSSSNTLLNSSHIQMGSSATSGGDSTSQSQQQVFSTSSPSSNNSSQGIVPDGGQFNLDFLDNLDCSTSDLLNFDVMQGGSTTFPLLEDMSMLDK